MRIDIENFTSLTGWTPESGSTISAYMLNSHPDYIAYNLPASVVFKIPTGNAGKYIQKTIAVNLTGYNEVTFSVWSRNKSSDSYSKSTDYKYKIEFGTAEVFYIPTYSKKLEQVTFSIAGAPITKIKITALHNDEDYLIMSHMVGSLEEMPFDLFTATKSALENELTEKYSNGIFLGKTTVTAGALTFTVSGDNKFLERYTVLKITDGVHSEIHQVDSVDGLTYKLTSLYDDHIFLNSYTNADVYIIVPVEFGVDSKEIILPGITIWGMIPEPVYRGSALENVQDTFKTDNTSASRREGRIQKYNILVDCESRNNELLAFASKIVRDWIAKETLWVNGNKLGIQNEGSPTEIFPTETMDIVPKIQYTFSVEIKEEIFNRQSSYPITTDNLSIFIQEQ
jgi:hypothetical protein